MMELDFVKISPTQNMTILIETDVAPDKRVDAASAIMAYDSVAAEQVGFITRPHGDARSRLDMAGGEFCLNATASLAAYEMWRGAEGGEMMIESSGMRAPLRCGTSRISRHDFRVTVDLPGPDKVESVALPIGGETRDLCAVHLPGITHIIFPGTLAHDEAEACAQRWVKMFDADAIGVMILDERTMSVTPLVCVESSGTLVWERGCGSGASAVGAYVARSARADASVDLRFPGGILRASATYSSGVTSLAVEGVVSIRATGRAYIKL